jgi:hypothetical protein
LLQLASSGKRCFPRIARNSNSQCSCGTALQTAAVSVVSATSLALRQLVAFLELPQAATLHLPSLLLQPPQVRSVDLSLALATRNPKTMAVLRSLKVKASETLLDTEMHNQLILLSAKRFTSFLNTFSLQLSYNWDVFLRHVYFEDFQNKKITHSAI